MRSASDGKNWEMMREMRKYVEIMRKLCGHFVSKKDRKISKRKRKTTTTTTLNTHCGTRIGPTLAPQPLVLVHPRGCRVREKYT